MITVISFVTKYFFRMLGSIYCYTKLLNMKPSKKEKLYAIPFSLISSSLLYFTNHAIPSFTLCAFLVCIILFCHCLLRPSTLSLPVSMCIGILSLGINYVLYFLPSFIVGPLLFYSFPDFRTSLSIKVLLSILCGIIQLLSLFYIFKIKRFQNGIPDIGKNFSNEACLLICMPVFYLSFLFSSETSARFIILFSLFLLITFLVILFLWWRNYLFHNYIQKSKDQTIKILEQTISEQNEELEKLSKIIHKDNKLIRALYLSVQELYDCTELSESSQLKKMLDSLAQEREGLLQTYEHNGKHLPKTKVFSTDVIVSYLFKRAFKNNIHFDVAITGDIRFMAETIIEETLLNTLLADLGENAIIATSNAKKRNILLVIGIKQNHYCIDFFDSGAHFDIQVIKNLGKQRYTTHKEEGGNGIGLMTIFELLEKKKGSFELEEFQENNLFTKRVSIIFDSRFETRIKSSREELRKTIDTIH